MLTSSTLSSSSLMVFRDKDEVIPYPFASSTRPGDRGDSGRDLGGDDGATPQDTNQDFYDKHRRRPTEDPDSSGDKGGNDDQQVGQAST